MKIKFLGWHGETNAGNEAFKIVMTDWFKDHQIEFCTPNNPGNDADIVVLGGGAVVSPQYLDALPNNKPLFALGVDLAHQSEAELFRSKPFNGIYLRHYTDLDLVKSCVTCPVELIPDLAFWFKPSGKKVLYRYKKTNKPTFGVFLTDYINPSIDRSIDKFSARSWSFQKNLAKQLDALADEWEILFFPCATKAYGDDRRIAMGVASFMKKPGSIVTDELSPQKIIDLDVELDLVLAMRFHAHIFALISGTPPLSIQFSRKTHLFITESRLEGLLAGVFMGDTFDASTLPQKVIAYSPDSKQRDILTQGWKIQSEFNWRDLDLVRQKVLRDFAAICS